MEYVLPISFILLGLVSFSLYAFVQAHRTWMNRRLDWAFRQDAFDKMTTKGPDFFNKFRTGDLITRLTDDIEGKLSWFACSGIFRFYEALAYVVFTLIMMVSINPWLTLMTAGPLPILIIIFFKTSTLLDKRYDELQTSISKFNAVMEACYSGIRVVKSYVQEKAQKKKFDEALTARRGKEIAAIKIRNDHRLDVRLYLAVRGDHRVARGRRQSDQRGTDSRRTVRVRLLCDDALFPDV